MNGVKSPEEAPGSQRGPAVGAEFPVSLSVSMEITVLHIRKQEVVSERCKQT